VAELVDAYINEWTACHWGRAKKVTHTGSNPVLTTNLKKIKIMELILYGIIGSLIGSLIVLITLRLFNPKPSIDYKELIKQSEERLEKSKKYGEELDRMLEEMRK
jgi:hypothetical protein